MDALLNTLTGAIESNFWLGPFFALIAGMITSLTPCALSQIPLIMGFVSSGKDSSVRSTRYMFKLSLFYALGITITFSLLGVLAGGIGVIFGSFNRYWLIFLGILMLLMALQTSELFNILPTNNMLSLNKKTGPLGAFIIGGISGIFASPCSTPVLVLLLGIISVKSNLLYGVLLMVCYSLGYSTLAVAAGTSLSFVKNLKTSKVYGRLYDLTKYILALLMAVLGLYLLYEGL